jgi:ABC-type nitrate/sulfonate/bicarbonate transport system permease component
VVTVSRAGLLLPFRLEFWSRGRLFRMASYLFALALWEIVGRSVGPLFLAGPSQVVVSLVNVTLSGELPLALLVSLQAFFVGFVAAIIVGIPLGMLMGRFESVERFFEPYISAFFVTPVSAFVPMIIIWFGIGIEARVVVVFSFSFFDIVINTFNGVRDIQYELVEPVRSLGANQRQTFQKVVLPAAAPFVMSGIRLGLGRAIRGMIIAELLLATTGLGGMIITYSAVFRTDVIFAVIIVIVLMGVGSVRLLKLLESRLFPWKQSSTLRGGFESSARTTQEGVEG